MITWLYKYVNVMWIYNVRIHINLNIYNYIHISAKNQSSNRPLRVPNFENPRILNHLQDTGWLAGNFPGETNSGRTELVDVYFVATVDGSEILHQLVSLSHSPYIIWGIDIPNDDDDFHRKQKKNL